MASHDSDVNLLCDLAFSTQGSNPSLSGALYRILGLSVRLSPRLILARRRRKLDSSRDTQSLELYHRIIWMSREGLSIIESDVVPNVERGGYGHEALDRDLKIFAAKLRASFFHIFCLFHNQPPVTAMNPTAYASQHSPLTPTSGNGHRKRHSGTGSNGKGRIEKGKGKESQATPRSRDRTAALRETIPSMASEASYITNPYSNPAISPPPGIPHPSAFLLPLADYRPVAEGAFKTALGLASDSLPGSAPLRLSIALEYSAFLWDCKNDHTGARRLAQSTIRNVYRASEGMEDDEFEEAAMFVGALGRMMRRKSTDATPRLGAASPGHDPGSDSQLLQTTDVPPLPLQTDVRKPDTNSGDENVRPPTSRGPPARKATGDSTQSMTADEGPSAPSPSPTKSPERVQPLKPFAPTRPVR